MVGKCRHRQIRFEAPGGMPCLDCHPDEQCMMHRIDPRRHGNICNLCDARPHHGHSHQHNDNPAKPRGEGDHRPVGSSPPTHDRTHGADRQRTLPQQRRDPYIQPCSPHIDHGNRCTSDDCTHKYRYTADGPLLEPPARDNCDTAKQYEPAGYPAAYPEHGSHAQDQQEQVFLGRHRDGHTVLNSTHHGQHGVGLPRYQHAKEQSLHSPSG